MSEEKEGLKRSLKARHLNMIAIGGAIGTGLFVASGASISTAGPGGALVAYALIGVMVYFLMTSLGEMATLMPVSGSFETYATRFVDPALGFALGWNYWYNWAITVACELVAGALVMKFWFPDVPGVIWSALFLVLLFALNFTSAKMYGEAEFWFAGIKVVTIFIFLAVGVLMIFGIMGGHNTGFQNWTIEDAPFSGGFATIFSIAMVAGFSFQGTELVGIAAGESENPEKNVPKAINTVFWRILIFYIGALTIIGFVLPYTDPNLLKAGTDNIAMSPFTLIFERAGLGIAAAVMNAVILTSVLSCGNSGLYASSRMLYAMAQEGKAPAFLKKVSKSGVPVNCLYFTTAISLIAFLGYLVGENTVYLWLVNASGMAGFIAWLGIAISHYRFRKAYLLQGGDLKDLKYRSKLFPLGPIIALVLCTIVIVGQDYQDIIKGNFLGALPIYIGLIVFLVFYVGYKVVKKTKVVDLAHADFSVDYHHEEK
ncbi:amino acid permease [Aminipila terrae]|uniref:Amino acid permease n=1 Tax=Aminipila terrae TaxID=2697030 RepID=A0A6P1MQK1_9FIRM|nr:amino acid permease [Aminipila terrae]QHI73275.1 amino acid permease [Aminipila terrae]